MSTPITAEQLDAELVKRLTLPGWDEVETELVEIYSSEISTYDGVKAVYGRIQDMLVHELIAARAAMAGDEAKQAAEGAWPPNAGDVWRDHDGGEWTAINESGRRMMRLAPSGGMDYADNVKCYYGPLTFVRHESSEAEK